MSRYSNIINQPSIMVIPDNNPWGGISTGWDILYNSKVLSFSNSVGTSIGTAEIEVANRKFGDEGDLFQPVKIVSISNGRMITLWRGVITKDSGILSTDTLKVIANDHKWFISKLGKVRGRIYTVDGTMPNSLGSPHTSGDGKFNYERFRYTSDESSGYLQNEECIFNRDGSPDCYIGNTSNGRRCIFYLGKVERDEGNGLDTDSWSGVEWTAKFWTFKTILKHIETYWIKPYYGTFSSFSVSSSSYRDLDDLENANIYPNNLSIEGLNPLEAVDKLIKSMPGRWVWWVDYSNGVTLEIRNIKKNILQDTDLIVGNNDKFYTANPTPNVREASISRDASDIVRYVVAKGGPLKVTTTVELIPLWKKFSDGSNYYDFQSQDDYDEWKEWNENKDDKNSTEDNDGLTQSKRERYEAIYRKYGVPKDGSTFVERIPKPSGEDFTLASPLDNEYSAFSTDISDMFFSNIVSQRSFEPPQFEKYGDKIIVFLIDPKCDYGDKEYNSKTSDDQEDNLIANNWKIRNPDQVNISYDIDEDQGIVTFEKAQYQRVLEHDNHDVEENPDYESAVEDMESRRVFVTATFDTNVSSILGKKRSGGIFDGFNDMDIVGYAEDTDVAINLHKYAWYPIDYDRKTGETITDSSEEIGDTPVGTKLRRCDEFKQQYTPYIGQAAQGLLTAAMMRLSSSSDTVITGTVNAGRLILGFSVGDGIQRIRNSRGNADSGYNDLECYISGVKTVNASESVFYESEISFTNKVSVANNLSDLGVYQKKRRDLFSRDSYFDKSSVPELDMPSWNDIEDFL